MSSTFLPHVAHRCIDDDLENFCHTEPSTSPWLSIRMPDHYQTNSTVSHILIFNRRDDCCMGRLSPFQIWVSSLPGDFNSATSQACGVHDLVVPAAHGPFSFDCGDLQGLYVTIVLPGDARILFFDVVRVFSDF